MSKQEKLVRKLLNLNGNFAWNDLVALLTGLDYKVIQGSGSRVKFDNGDPTQLINLHKPHPGNELKRYARLQVIEKLKAGGLI
jgi:hypothetical protein